MWAERKNQEQNHTLQDMKNEWCHQVDWDLSLLPLMCEAVMMAENMSSVYNKWIVLCNLGS